MIKVNSRISLNLPTIRRLENAQIDALEKTAEALHTEVVQAEVMPRDTGAMQNESTFVDYSKSARGRVSIVTSTPYARRLYFHPEYDYQKYENAFAMGKWYEPWINGVYADFCRDTYEKMYRRLAKL